MELALILHDGAQTVLPTFGEFDWLTEVQIPTLAEQDEFFTQSGITSTRKPTRPRLTIVSSNTISGCSLAYIRA